MNLKAGETLLYKTQFLDSLGPEWTGAKITQNFQAIENVLGPFNKEAISFQLPLKEKHQFVRLKFRITFLGNWGGSGNVGNDNIFEFGTSEHPDLIYASFNTLGYKYTANSLQSFPDQRNAGDPVRHWLNRTGTGFLERGRYKYNNNAEYARDTTYDFDFLIPHNKGHLELKFFSHRKGKNSNWLISYLEVSTREEALSLSPKQLKEALYMLRSKDAARAYQAKWRLIGHGKEVLNFLNDQDLNPAKYLLEKMQNEDFSISHEARLQITSKGSFYRPELESLSQDTKGLSGLLKSLPLNKDFCPHKLYLHRVESIRKIYEAKSP